MTDKQKSLLDKSSEVNRNLGLFFVGFLFYLLLTTSGISDLQLLMQSNGVALPFISITLPLTAFAWVAPVIILGVHLNLLLNLLEHAVKFKEWYKVESLNLTVANETPQLITQKQMHPFLFNYTLVRSKGFSLFITKLLVNLFSFFMPMLVLHYIQFRFSDMHDRTLSLYHFFIFSLDAALVGFFYFKFFVQKEKAFKKPKRPVNFISTESFSLLTYIDNTITNFLSLIRQAFRHFGTIQFYKLHFSFNKIFDKLFFSFLITAAILNLLIVYIITDKNKYKIVVAYKLGESWGTIIKLYGDTAFFNAYHPTFIQNQTPVSRPFPPLPAITIHGEKIAVYNPSLQEMLIAKQAVADQDSLLVEYTKGIDLQGKDLSFADFENCELINANLESSKLMFSNFHNCKLSKAIFTNSLLESADLSGSQLHNSKLEYTLLKNANLQKCDLNWANLAYAQMQNADFSFALLDNAVLTDTDIQNASFENAILHNTNLSGSIILNGRFSNANMQGSDLSNAVLNDIDLSYCDIQGANLANVFLQGANLSNTVFQGSNLFNANLQGANLINANLKGTNLHSAKLQGANLSFADIRGSLIVDALVKYTIWTEVISNGAIIENPDTSYFPEEFIKTKTKLKYSYEDSLTLFQDMISDENYDVTILYAQKTPTYPPPSSPSFFIKERIDLLNNPAIPLRKLFITRRDVSSIKGFSLINKCNFAIIDCCKRHFPARQSELLAITSDFLTETKN